MAMLAPPFQPAGPTNLSMTKSSSSKSQRPTPIQRRSTLKRSIDDTNTMNVTSSPSKRARVTFDSEVEIVSADDEDDLDPAVVKEQVRRSIERHRYGDDEAYERIRGVFTADPDKERAPSARSMKSHLQAVLANVASLTKDCIGLVNAVLSSEWVGRDDVYYTIFVRFLNNLAAAQRGYQVKIMQSLVELLGPQKTRRLPNTKPVRQPKIHDRVFRAIQHITANVPTASGALADQLAIKLGFEFEKPEERMTYIKNSMQLINVVPELSSDILNNIMQELIKLDVCIQDSLEDVEDEVEEELLEYMSTSQTLIHSASQTLVPDALETSDEDYISSSDDSEFDEDELAPDDRRQQKLKSDIKQVDQIMDLLFSHYNRLITSNSSPTTRHNTVETLIAQFHHFILPTYRSRHPQFLIFHFAQTDPILVDRFVTDCVATLLDKRQSPIVRHAAAAFFSGFVGRGAHVPPTLVNDCLALLCDSLNNLRAQYEPQCRGFADMKRFSDFYAVFQAILYIFCFRWNDIVSTSTHLDFDDESEDEDEDQSQKTYHVPDSIKDSINAAMYSPLNPLRVCTQMVVQQFAQITMELKLFFVFGKIEDNKRATGSMGSWRSIADLDIRSQGSASGTNADDSAWMADNGMLEGYFPYDPYHLPVSRRWIEGDYVEWKGTPMEQWNRQAGENETSDEEGEMDDEDEE